MKGNPIMDTNIIVKETPSELKRLSLIALKDLWLTAAVGAIIYELLVSGIPEIASALFPRLDISYTDPQTGLTATTSPFNLIYQFILIGPFLIGWRKYVLNIIRWRKVETRLVFHGFEKFFRSLLMRMLITIFVTLWTMPAAVVFTFLSMYLPSLNAIGMGVMLGFAIWAYARYSMAPFIMADEEGISSLKAIRESKERMKYNITSYITLIVSFIGWVILASLPSMATIYMIKPTNGSLLYTIVRIVTNLPMCLVLLYETTSEGFFYEILMGKIRKVETPVNPQVYPQ